MSLLKRVKKNLIITHSEDDAIINDYIAAATSYAESYQHLETGYYKTNKMSDVTKQAVVMLASFFYESRDGGTAGFFSNTASSTEQVWNSVNALLRLDRSWKV